VHDYSFAAAFANDAYVDRETNDTVALASMFKSFSPCLNISVKVVTRIRNDDSLAGLGVLKQGTDVNIYELESSNTFILAFRGTEGADCLTSGSLKSEGCMDFAQDWINPDMQGWGIPDEICPNNEYSAPLWYRESNKVHFGFQTSYQAVQEIIRDTLALHMDESSTLYITGLTHG
jgi:hypothetical protein